ncbi:MAG TPA: hypothetical protein VKG43_10225 [Acidimicrobiales bacterium]|nr:hypothetical protein [Acidimicrobiales bacterium]
MARVTMPAAIAVLAAGAALGVGAGPAGATPATHLSSFGQNLWGTLGNGTTTDSNVPVSVNGLTGITAISAGAYDSLAVVNGNVWAWGSNQFGQLGIGLTTGPQTCNSGNDPCSNTPVEVEGVGGVGFLSNVVAVAASNAWYFNLALLGNGTVVAWGANGFGELGDGTTIDRSTPVVVAGLSNVTAIAAGGYFGLALDNTGTVWSWGSNFDGDLGLGNDTGPTTACGIPCSTNPVVVPGLSNVTAIAAGEQHGLALLSNHTVDAWGLNSDGQLGNNSSIGPNLCPNPTNTDGCSWSPIPVPGLTNVTAIAAGSFHSLALRTNHKVKAWGLNDQGQIGHGTFLGQICGPSHCYKHPVAVNSLTHVSAISAGGYHNLAIYLAGGTMDAAAWGYDDHGQLGNASNANTDLPVPVSGLSTVGVLLISAGGYHSLVGTT